MIVLFGATGYTGARVAEAMVRRGLRPVLAGRDTGKLATPNCPRVRTETFLAGTEPTEVCPLHKQ